MIRALKSIILLISPHKTAMAPFLSVINEMLLPGGLDQSGLGGGALGSIGGPLGGSP